MSLFNVKPPQVEKMKKVENVTTTRQDLKTVAEFKEDVRLQANAYQKKHRQSHLGEYSKQKKIIDKLDKKQLQKYVEDNHKVANEARVGNYNMKINAYEFALIKLALASSEARSTRELFFDLLEQAGLTQTTN